MQSRTQLDPDLLTQSTRLALRYAAHHAATRAAAETASAETMQQSVQQKAVKRKAAAQQAAEPAVVSVGDLLVGMVYAHPSDAEPLVLLLHAGVPSHLLLDTLGAGHAAERPPRSQLPELSPLPVLDGAAEDALAAALDAAQQYNPETPSLVRLRDLFAGVLPTETCQDILARLLPSHRIDLRRLMEVYPDYLAADTATSFAAFLTAQFGNPVPLSPTGGAVNVAMAIPDSPSGEDFVMIGPEVDALSYLLAARDLRPPLAVGLFGDWGAGKSFFMEALRARVHEITKAARHSGRAQSELAVYKSIVQIEFNAWHYVDGNLWASLVEHIFRNLQVEAREAPSMLEQRQSFWIDKLETERRALAEVDARLKALNTQKEKREASLRQKRTELKLKRQKLGGLRVSDFVDAVDLGDADRKLVLEAYRGLGIDRVAVTAREALEALESAREQIRRGNALTAPLRDGRTGARWAAALAACVLGGPALVAAAGAIGAVELSVLQQVGSAVGGTVIALAGYLRAGTSWVTQTLDRVDRANAALESRVSARHAEEASTMAGLETEIEAIETEESELHDQVGELTRAIAAVEMELSTLTPAQVLLDFISERVGSSDYRKHLGIAALIRRDFEQLTALIEQQNETFLKQDTGGPWTDERRHVVNRIVLYIDDLDRCPPGRVVEVLQAIHLLLAFPLFVVVVAVDSRWLSRSLLSHYSELLAGGNGVGGGNGADTVAGARHGGDRATPGDYLEKIFQIPFHVRPLDEHARGRIVLGLLRDSVDADDEPLSDDIGTPGRRAATLPPRFAVEHTGDRAARDVARNQRAQLQAAPDLNPASMLITRKELLLMAALRPVLGRTPRAVKRFVNVYRLVKSIAGARGEHFLEPAAPGAAPAYEPAMFLLAVATGLPDIAADVFANLADAAHADAAHADADVPRTLQELAARLEVDTANDSERRPDARRLARWLATDAGADWAERELRSLAPQLDLVSRFSFRSELGLEA